MASKSLSARLANPRARFATLAMINRMGHMTHNGDLILNWEAPASHLHVPSEVIDLRSTRKGQETHGGQALRLADMFVKNFAKYGKDMPLNVTMSGPQAIKEP